MEQSIQNKTTKDGKIITVYINRRDGETIKALIDAEDFNKISPYRYWRIVEGRGLRYIGSSRWQGNKKITVLLQQIIYGPTKRGNKITFKNNQYNDCRKSNLMEVSQTELLHRPRYGSWSNLLPIPSRPGDNPNKSCGYRNIYKNKCGTYNVAVKVAGKMFTKSAKTLAEAIKIRDAILTINGLDGIRAGRG